MGQENAIHAFLSYITPWANSITDAPHSFVEGNSYAYLISLHVHVCDRSLETGTFVISLSVAASNFRIEAFWRDLGLNCVSFHGDHPSNGLAVE